jgi:ClpP class serine protease
MCLSQAGIGRAYRVFARRPGAELNERIRSGIQLAEKKPTVVQTLIFSKEKFTKAEAKKWAKDHDYKSSGVDETEDSYRIRQRDPGDFVEGSFRTIELDDGVSAVVGHLKSGSSARAEGPRAQGIRADLPSGAAHVVEPLAVPALVRVYIMGPLEQRAGYHEPCAGWSDGHDAVAERLCAAFAEGDVLLCMDSPGGAHAGLQQGVERALAAKAKYGRRCTGWINEQMGSACTWWGMALCDEIFGPPAMQAGSIGARGQHESIAGLLEQQGVKVTYFADPPEKVAFAPELPLSAIGEARGNRDVTIAATAFRAAVCASPLGVRAGLTPDGLIELGADMLSGQAAVDAGLADGVASEDDVIDYALKLAQRGAQKGQETRTEGRRRAHGVKMGTRAEDERRSDRRADEEDEDRKARRAEDDDRKMRRAEDEDDEEPPPSSQPMPPSSKPGREIPSACAACGVQNEDDAKYCKGCGASMATKRMDDEDEDEDEEDEDDRKAQPPPPKRMSGNSGLAEILGLREDASLPAQKAAAIDLRQVFDHASALTGQRDPGAVLGALSAMSEDAAASGRLRRERDAIQRRQDRTERDQLAHRLVAAGVARGDVFRDRVSDSGKRLGVELAPQYAEMRLSTLRGVVEQKERNRPRRNPFEPDRSAAEAQSKSAGKGDQDARIEAAKNHPTVLRMFHAPGNTHPIDAIAKQFVLAQNAMGGAA